MARKSNDDRVTVTFDIPWEVWDLLKEVTAFGQDWHDVAARALEAGLEQVNAPTDTTRQAPDEPDS